MRTPGYGAIVDGGVYESVTLSETASAPSSSRGHENTRTRPVPRDPVKSPDDSYSERTEEESDE